MPSYIFSPSIHSGFSNPPVVMTELLSTKAIQTNCHYHCYAIDNNGKRHTSPPVVFRRALSHLKWLQKDGFVDMNFQDNSWTYTILPLFLRLSSFSWMSACVCGFKWRSERECRQLITELSRLEIATVTKLKTRPCHEKWLHLSVLLSQVRCYLTV